MATVVPRFANSPCAIRSSGDAAGRHTDEVLRDELQLEAAELQALRDAGVV